MKKICRLGALLLPFVSASAFAGGGIIVVATGGGNQTQTHGYAGLVWTLGGKKPGVAPDLVVGVRSLKVKANDRVTSGADLNARFSVVNGFAFDNLRLSHVSGTRDLLGNVGAGYSPATKSFFGTFSAQGAYSRAGLDYEFSAGRISPTIELLSLGTPRKVKGSGLGCNSTDPYFYVRDGAHLGDYCGHY